MPVSSCSWSACPSSQLHLLHSVECLSLLSTALLHALECLSLYSVASPATSRAPVPTLQAFHQFLLLLVRGACSFFVVACLSPTTWKAVSACQLPVPVALGPDGLSLTLKVWYLYLFQAERSCQPCLKYWRWAGCKCRMYASGHYALGTGCEDLRGGEVVNKVYTEGDGVTFELVHKGRRVGIPEILPPSSPAGRRCHATFNYRAFSSPHNSANSLPRQGERVPEIERGRKRKKIQWDMLWEKKTGESDKKERGAKRKLGDGQQGRREKRRWTEREEKDRAERYKKEMERWKGIDERRERRKGKDGEKWKGWKG